MTSYQRRCDDHVASTLIRRHFDNVCLLGYLRENVDFRKHTVFIVNYCESNEKMKRAIKVWSTINEKVTYQG